MALRMVLFDENNREVESYEIGQFSKDLATQISKIKLLHPTSAGRARHVEETIMKLLAGFMQYGVDLKKLSVLDLFKVGAK